MSWAPIGTGMSAWWKIRLAPDFVEKMLVLYGFPVRIGTDNYMDNYISQSLTFPGTIYVYFPSITFLIDFMAFGDKRSC